jgi:hypothetical protein
MRPPPRVLLLRVAGRVRAVDNDPAQASRDLVEPFRRQIRESSDDVAKGVGSRARHDRGARVRIELLPELEHPYFDPSGVVRIAAHAGLRRSRRNCRRGSRGTAP